MQYEHEGAEQTFARFYANALASIVINSNPKSPLFLKLEKTENSIPN
jgi:hypothetical protein